MDERTLPSLAPIGWTGERVALSASAGVSSERVVFFEPGSGRWETGAFPPACPAEDDGYEQAAWVGDRYVAPCGTDRIQVYDVDSDVWTTIVAGRSPLNTRIGSAIVWSGSDLIAWSGTVKREGNPTPNSGSAITLMHR